MNVNRPDHPGRSRDALGKIFDSMMADIKEQPSPKQEAIANADAHTNNAGLPTYSELVEALRLTHQQMQKTDGESHAWHEANDAANAVLSRIPA